MSVGHHNQNALKSIMLIFTYYWYYCNLTNNDKFSSLENCSKPIMPFWPTIDWNVTCTIYKSIMKPIITTKLHWHPWYQVSLIIPILKFYRLQTCSCYYATIFSFLSFLQCNCLTPPCLINTCTCIFTRQ